jgi:hypothetical protein
MRDHPGWAFELSEGLQKLLITISCFFGIIET